MTEREVPPDVHGLVGRKEVWAHVRALLDHAVDDGYALLVVGEPGIGKTALLTAAAVAAREAMLVLRCAGSEYQPANSYAGLDQLLRPLRREFAELSDDQRAPLEVALGLAAGTVPSAVPVAVASLALLRRTAGSRPVLLIVDDVQWLDPASWSVLAYIARRLAGTPIGLLATARPDIAQIPALIPAGLATLEIEPLPDEHARALLESRFPDLAGSVAQRVLKEAGGVPLALLELPRALTQDESRAAQALPRTLRLTPRLGRLFSSRITSLPAETRQTLLLGAFSGGDLATLRATDGTDVLSRLAEAERTHLVSIHDDRQRLEFRHPLVRATVVGLASEVEQRRAHLALAEAVRQDVERRAWHLADAAVGPSAEVADLLEESAMVGLQRGDAAAAVRALTRAAELTPSEDERARRYLHAASIGADVHGDLNTATELVSVAARGIVPASLDAAVAVAHLLLNAEADVTTAHRLLVDAIASHPTRTDAHDPVLLDALHTLVVTSWWGGRPDLWEPVRQTLSGLSPSVPMLLDLCARSFGDPVRLAAPVLAAADDLRTVLTGEQNPVTITRAAIGCVYLDRLTECREALWQVIRDGRSGGAAAVAVNAIVSSCVDDWLTGQWDEALDLAAEGEQLCERHGYRRYSFILSGYIRALIDAARGDTDAPMAAADDLVDWGVSRDAGIAVQFAHHIRTVVALGQRRYDDAFASATAVSPAGRLAPYTPHALWLLLDVVESAVQAGRLPDARAHVAAIRAAGLAGLSPRLALVADGCAALVAAPDDADELYERAVNHGGGDRWPFDLARIRLAYGGHLRRRRAPVEARHQFQQALTVFDRLGARPWSVQAAEGLRATGGPGVRRIPSDLSGINPQQRRIVQLAASGLTNKQIGAQMHVSHRTVGSTLYQLFPKLGVTSRAGLRDALRASEDGFGLDDA